MGNFVRSFWLLQASVISFSSSVLAIPLDDAASVALGTGPPTAPTAPAGPRMGTLPAGLPMGTGVTAPPSTTSSAPVGSQSEIYRYINNCNDQQKAMIENAWNDAKDIALAHNKWEPSGWFFGGKYQAAQDMYLGTDSSTNSWFGKKWAPFLQQTMQRQVNIHTDSAPFRTYAFFYCDESKSPTTSPGECGRPNTPGKKVAAYTWDDLGGIFGWSAHHVVLCPTFFDTVYLDDLKTKVEEARNNPSMQMVINNFRKNPSSAMFHETYHWKDTVSNPRTGDIVYDPQGIVDLAKTSNTERSSLNAESWAMAAMAMYIQQTFDLPNPPAPGVPSIDDNVFETHAIDPPAGFISPLYSNSTIYNGANDPIPDPSQYIQVGGPIH